MIYDDQNFIRTEQGCQGRLTAESGAKKIGTAPRKEMKVWADARIFQGTMATPSTAQRTWPRLIVMYLGIRPVRSAPKAMVLVPMLVPTAEK
jgi:hypothetical protein